MQTEKQKEKKMLSFHWMAGKKKTGKKHGEQNAKTET